MWELLSNEQETKKKNNLFVLSFHPDDETSANLQGVPAQDCQLWLDLGLLHQLFFSFLKSHWPPIYVIVLASVD